MSDRYDASGSEAEYQPGSGGLVLRNLQGVITPKEMDELELILLEKLYQVVLGEEFPDRRLIVADLKRWHRQWLGNVYPWAGEERSVNMAKEDFFFAVAAQIPRLLDAFERDCLARFTPAHDLNGEDLIGALAITHVELILIHPFREGNGRLARLLADVMAVQAGHAPLDYGSWDADRSAYYAAIQHGHAHDYEPMSRLVERALDS